jgi:CRISPR-associated protein Csd1
MLLQRLKDYSARLNLPPTLYSEASVRYIIELDGAGNFAGITDTADPSSRRTRRGQPRLVPQVQRSSGVRPLLLADKADYVLGYADKNAEPDRVKRVEACHKAFVELVDRCAAATSGPEVMAVQHFLKNCPLDKLELDESFDPGATITFRVAGQFPIDLPSIQSFWASENDPESAAAMLMQCIVCGQERPALERLQGKIKGVPGGQTAGTSIISANAEAFESYGLKASLISPTCAECGERFTKAANQLLSSEANSIRVGGVAFIFWTREEVGFNFLSFMTDPHPEQIRELIGSVRTGHFITDLDDTPFYATALSGSGGRAVVRDWLDTTVGEVREHLKDWFLRQRIVDSSGEEDRPLGLYALAYATVREAKDLPATVPRTLLRSALRNYLKTLKGA